MRQKIAAGLGAGLIAGLVLGVVMRVVPISVASGRQITMITVAARLIHAGSPLAGWLAYAVYAVVLGVLFGVLLFAGRESTLRTAVWGGAWGIGWFLVAGFWLLPVLLGSRPLSAPALRELDDIAVPLLIGHIAYGLALGAGFRLILNAFPGTGSSGRARPGTRRAA